MTRRNTVLICAILTGLMVLAGCTAGPPPGPSPTVTGSSTPTPTPTPKPKWTPDEQAAIDAVNAYLAEWSRIGQHLDTEDWTSLHRYALDTLYEDALATWQYWNDRGWHLVGTQSFVALKVKTEISPTGDLGTWVDGCLSIAGSDVVDASGTSMGGSDRRETAPVFFSMFRGEDGSFVPFASAQGDWSC